MGKLLTLSLCICVFLFIGCTSDADEPVAAVTEIAPTDTPVAPTETPEPTATLEPSPTSVPPTETPVPTETLAPTPQPTATEASITVLKDIPYIPDGNLKQVLDIYLPPEGDGPFPVLFLIHIFGGDLYGGDKRDFKDTAEHFADQGYGVISVNYRIASHYEYPARIEDIACALAWIHTNGEAYDLDPSFVVATGASMGATYAALMGTIDDFAPYLEECPSPQPEGALVNSVIGLYGGYDLTKKNRYQSYYWWGALEDSLGVSLEEDPDKYMQASPINYVDGSEPPFLLIHGEDADDYDGTSAGESTGFADVLTEAGVKVELVLIPGVRSEFLGHIGHIPDFGVDRGLDSGGRDAAWDAMEVFLADLLEGR